MNILVTGGAGFIGSHLVDKLIKQGHHVLVLDDLSTGKKNNVNKKAQFIKVDIRSPKISAILNKFKPEIVYHLAAQVSVSESVAHPSRDADINIVGSLNIITNCLKLPVRKFIYFSSGGAMYGEAEELPTSEDAPAFPLSPYGQAKMAIENYLHSFNKTTGLDFVCLRLANVYGPRQEGAKESGVITIFIKNLLAGKPLPIHGRGEQTRDFVYVDDVVEVACRLLTKGSGIYNVGTATETPVRQLVIMLGEISGSVPHVAYESSRGASDVKNSCLSFNKAKKELGWRPQVDLITGLGETINWFKGI